MATGTGARLNEMGLGRAQERWPLTAMALLPAVFACGGSLVALGLVEGGIRRRRLTRYLGGLLDASLEGLDLLLELSDLLVLVLEVVLHSRRGELPLHVAKGQGPQDGVARRLRGRRLYHPGSRRCGVSSVSLLGTNASKLERGLANPRQEPPCERILRPCLP